MPGKIKGIFCHDLPIYKDVNGVYCSTTLTNDLFKRYFHVVDSLVVAVRVYPIDTTYAEAHQERISLPNLHVLELPNVNSLSAPFREIPQARKFLMETMRDMDLVFIRGGTIALLGATIARKLKKAYLLECAGCAWDAYWNHSLLGKMIAPYMEYRAKQDVRNASHVIYVTEEWLQNRYPTNGSSTYASNVNIEISNDKALEKRLTKIKVRPFDAQLVIGTTAAVNVRYKGQQYIIEAMGRIKETLPNIRYELVGGGDQSYLKTVAQKHGVADRVVFHGSLRHGEVFDWLESIDIYAQPSRQEGLPRALIEAMSCACPAIGAATAGIPELLDADYIFANGDINGIVRVLTDLAESDLCKVATRNFNKAKEYDSSILNARREKLYEQYRDLAIRRKR